MVEPARFPITLTVNGMPHSVTVEPRRTLLDCLRDDLVFPGTHVGCEHGVCGCCNVIVDGALVRSCLMLAVQADGADVETIEGVGTEDELSPIQEAFCARHAMQCGYCTPGMVMTLEDLLRSNPQPSEEELVDAVSGNLCRCTGYQQILQAARSVIADNAAKAGQA
ncbi:MAG TPA: (2Fe-2S)-binding protein [Pseudonocardiaceae bacterium]|nr:(2Fe-2S)-binding protein [Pseudonocardiaceae bacterium]